MTNELRKAAEMALAALKGASLHDPEAVQEEISVLEQALAQQEQWKTCRHCGFDYKPPKADKWYPLAQPEEELGQYEQELMASSAEQYKKELAMEKFSKVNQEIEEAIKKGTKAWADVPDATKWVDELRGGEEQEPKFGACVTCGALLEDQIIKQTPEREWVGLTEDEFESILKQHNEAFPFTVYQSIEAKLKEKNGVGAKD
jgi:hypothetical protein